MRNTTDTTKDSPGFPARRQFYWKRKLHLFDLLFFPSSIVCGVAGQKGRGEDGRNFRINCAREETFLVDGFGVSLHCLPWGCRRGASGIALALGEGRRGESSGLGTSRMALRLYQCHSRWVIRAKVRHLRRRQMFRISQIRFRFFNACLFIKFINLQELKIFLVFIYLKGINLKLYNYERNRI